MFSIFSWKIFSEFGPVQFDTQGKFDQATQLRRQARRLRERARRALDQAHRLRKRELEQAGPPQLAAHKPGLTRPNPAR